MNNYEITKFAQLFNDELTLDNLERIHLVNLCRFVGISPFGTDNFLVTRLRGHLYRIKVLHNDPPPPPPPQWASRTDRGPAMRYLAGQLCLAAPSCNSQLQCNSIGVALASSSEEPT